MQAPLLVNHVTELIAAIATAPGHGGIGVVRISGSDVRFFANQLSGIDPKPRHAHFCKLRDALGDVLDEGILLYFPAPNSYTGESVLEFQGHGGPAVLNLVLDRCIELGARLALPGEFTKRAFLNNRIDLVQAESVSDLIEASSAQAARAALRSLSGVFSHRINGLCERLIELRMLVEASIDFPEEDIDILDKFNVCQRLLDLQNDLDALSVQAQSGKRIRDGVSVVIAGPPNVGKSTLLNAFAGDDVAIVTPYAGTTRDPITETIQVGPVLLSMTDTAGLHKTLDPIETEGISRAHKAMKTADLVLWVIDATSKKLSEPENIPENVPVWKIYNKIDLIEQHSGLFGGIAVSAHSGFNLNKLREELRIFVESRDFGEGAFTARNRHIEALRLTRDQLDQALQNYEVCELLAESLRTAHQTLSRITGTFDSEALLGEIFSRFCIGK
ncbi:MAG TPA: tRNA uridine-5-carboxymethylaminomethyl(34) synthesis GTPase MnmE [Burkholderiales bacterium]|nr:tRNA uridine-5-carboxymethylaminomethyl(34) synthesis GTPase MnmE [Burkholderiales bacterium]